MDKNARILSNSTEWPTTDELKPTTTGRSPLLMTMFHSTLEQSWRCTYSWIGQLDQPMLVSHCWSTPSWQSLHTKGPSISESLWNHMHHSACPLLPTCKVNNPWYIVPLSGANHTLPSWLAVLESHHMGNPMILQQPTRSHIEDNPSTACPRYAGNPLTLGNQWNGYSGTPTNFCSWHALEIDQLYVGATTPEPHFYNNRGSVKDASWTTPSPIIAILPHTPQCIPSTGATPLSKMAELLIQIIIQLCAQSFKESGFEAQKLTPPTVPRSHWPHHQPTGSNQPEKSWRSCHRWTIAVIQKLWDMAWDLLAHQNVEDAVRAWPACYIKFALADDLIHQNRPQNPNHQLAPSKGKDPTCCTKTGA